MNKTEILNRLRTVRGSAGYVTHRPNKVTGDFNTLYDGEAAGLDVDAGRWQTVCETHGQICSHTSKKIAMKHLASGDWCEECSKPRCEACCEPHAKLDADGLCPRCAKISREVSGR